ncbi:DNA-binding transcriptional regulator YdaS (Cro superfamily) [Arthrobacter sp. CAN_C5]|nr:DNA-binding transcriptional regulator YdaS (Cro superfamily) [Arthrobacter sp. CAN_C5]
MDHNSKIMPDESFPEDLTGLDDTEVQVLNSKVRRELDAEYLDSNPEPETEGRLGVSPNSLSQIVMARSTTPPR